MEGKEALHKESCFTNLNRARIFTIGLILIHLVLLVIDINRLLSGQLDTHTGYRYLFYLHIVLTAGLAIFLLFFYLYRITESADIRLIHKVLVTSFVLFLLLISASITSIDQLIHGEVTVYVICFLAVAVGCYLPFYYRLALFVPSFVLVLIGVSFFQSNEDILIGNYINISLVFVIGFILSQIVYKGFKKSFFSQMTIKRQQEQLEKMSMEDSLTGLRNRRYIDLKLMEEWDRAVRYDRDLALAIADLDRFKDVNDTYGHNVGDTVLRTLGVIFRGSIRGVDRVARFGGEEFLLLFPETNKDQAYTVCEKVRKQTKTYPWGEVAKDMDVSISFGVAEIKEAQSIEEFINCADKRLYEAKRGGRNRTCMQKNAAEVGEG
jgi:diguanylate cyclase (GGDEF)-like protein